MHTAPAKATLVCLLAGALFWAGCAAVPLQPAEQPPEWQQRLERVQRQGERLAGHGSAAPDRPDAAARASAAARRELAEAVRSYVEQVLAEFFSERLDHPVRENPLRRQVLADVATGVAATVLRETPEAETWHAEDGDVHAIASVPTEQVHQHAQTRLAALLASQNPFPGSAEQISSEAAAYLRTVSRRQRLNAVLSAPPPEGTAPPRWLQRPRHPEYPAERFLLAVGMGPDAEAAGEDARKQLLTRMNGELAELREELQASPDADALTQNARFVGSGELQFSASELAALRRVDHWRDPVTGTVYVLSALNRETAVLVLEEQLGRTAERAAQLLAAARNQARAGNLWQALTDDLAALQTAREAVSLQMKGLLMAPAGRTAVFRRALAEPLLQDAHLSLEDVLSEISVTAVSGDGQWLAPGRPPTQPFVALVTGGGRAAPLPGVPMRLRLKGTNVELGQATTDTEGLATWSLTGAPTEAGSDGVLLAELDLAALSPQADLSRLPVPSAAFEFMLRSGADTSFVIMARGEPSGEFESALAEVLRQYGLRPVEPDLLLRHLKALDPTSEPSDAEVLDAFAELRDALGEGRFLLIVWGRAESEAGDVVQTEQGELSMARCPFEFRLLDPALPGKDKRLATLSGAGQGASLAGSGEARSRATADALAEVREHMRRCLRERFGAAGAQ
ncbi:MAG: hypothetical protein R6V05_05760 [Candidatus Brocadiia bacterium]